jgi:hypothetical protein
MKKAISLLLMSFMNLAGTFAWAGSAREDTVAMGAPPHPRVQTHD